MTTIAFRDGVMAADSRGCFDSTISPDRAKKLIVSEKHGCVFGVAGSCNRAVSFVRLLEQLPRLPWNTPEKNLDFSEFQTDEHYFTLIAMQWDGKLFSFETGHWLQLDCDFYAIGSGIDAALAAMYMGADAAEAIQIASLCDSKTDANVVCHSAGELTKPAYLSARARSPKPRSRPAQAAPARSKSRASRKKPA